MYTNIDLDMQQDINEISFEHLLIQLKKQKQILDKVIELADLGFKSITYPELLQDGGKGAFKFEISKVDKYHEDEWYCLLNKEGQDIVKLYFESSYAEFLHKSKSSWNMEVVDYRIG